MNRWLQRFWRSRKKKHSRTVRFAFPVTILFVAALGAAVLSSQGGSFVRVETEPSYVRAGERFVISIYASASTPTNAVDIQVEYPEAQIEILGIDTGESVVTIWTEDPYARGGVISLRGGIFRKGFLGEHLIARVDARAVESGVAQIVTSDAVFLAGDGKGSTVAVSKTGLERAEVRISSAGVLESDLAIGIVTDLDGDGDVDFSDIQHFMRMWRDRSTTIDFNGDGQMTFRDFGILLAHAFFK